MGASTKLFWVLSGFFLLAALVYLVWNTVFFAGNAQVAFPAPASPVEWVGTIGLLLTSLLAALIAFYLGRSHRAQHGELPEDRVNATVDDGDAEQGFFSPWSWWPIVLAACAALLFLGLAIGMWLMVIGATLGVIALVGWTYEYYRRYFGH
ncbi:cytochrome c oxidase subunit IV [Glaciihabitans tibetensis]|uniref:cytochrome-c oxidase n=1 Tax=Glaciihabitans tibetensis TaxID=1266600 RepID=A0A2T0VK50_9MICO|nr:cytochrome c oxidase subunit 4 [Glaciihabitans tibetensis]PRY70601.1 cytochrome c oxidase subunit IV [Glaciihabitans tibetensis]